jgi:DNA (cytosine-5)-methyltransferase 1
MADGAQRGFAFHAPGVSLLRPGEIVVDLFAGGGGASEALRQALGRDPDIAINHDLWAIGMHAVNHPFTFHLPADVWHAHPLRLVAGRPVGWLHLSPDCTHFSQAKGGQPRKRTTRSLSWVALKWIGMLARVGLAPRIVSLENVMQILGWCPLVARRCRVTGKVVRIDGTVAAPDERVPVDQQWLVPDPKRCGRTWRQFVAALRAFGYAVEWRVLDASHYGAGTDRKRLYMIARRDGEPIGWPAATHSTKPNQQPIVSAAQSIDWDVLGSSIFNRPRPLRPNTIRRLLDGAERARWPRPYLDALIALRDGRKPDLRITAEQAEAISQQFGHRPGLVMATGAGGVGRPVSSPLMTITAGGNGAAPHFIRPVIVHKHNSDGGRGARSVDEPVPTIATRGAGYLAEPIIAPYYGSGSGHSGQPCSRTMPTVTTKARFGLAEPVVVSTCNTSSRGVRLASDPVRTITTARGGDQALAEPVLAEMRIDILYRMLFERELFNAQGFPPNYIIDRTADGRRLTRAQSIRMVGNSVSPPPLAAIARANLDPVESLRAAA